MKAIKYLTLTLSLLLTLVSCNESGDKLVFHPEDVKSSELNAAQPSYVLLATDANKVAETFTWGEMDFGFPAAIKYTLEIDLVGKDFANAKELSASFTNSSEITVKALNDVMMALQKVYEFPKDAAQQVELRVVGSITDAMDEVYSLNTITTTVTPFAPLLPDELYMVGEEFGDWDWGSTNIVEMIPVNGVEGAFWCINYFTGGKTFKWSDEKSWNGANFEQLTTNVGFDIAGGNASVATSGLYTVYIDYDKGKITIEPATVYGIGDIFGGWDQGLNPFTIQNDKMTITVPASGELRMYAGSSIATTDWWTREFIILDGKIEYRGRGNDQTRVSVATGQIVTLDFRNNTGTIQ